MKNLIFTLFIILLHTKFISAQVGTVQGTGIINESVLVINGVDNLIDFEIINFSNEITLDKHASSGSFLLEPNAKALGNSITFTRKKGANSLLFHNKIITGTDIDELKIWFSRPIDSPSLKTYLKYELTDVFVVRIQETNDFYENIEVVFKRLKIFYSPVLIPGELGPEISYGWDFAKNSSF
jgi:type VI protein secretion system component Hcp